MKSISTFRVSTFFRTTLSLAVISLAGTQIAMVSSAQRVDSRLETLSDADHFELQLRVPPSREEWEARRKLLRQKVLISAGLWPKPHDNPLNASVFDQREGDGFTVSKVYFESLPGFLATGNLYRPTRGQGPYPAILSPHGHWEFGRLQNGPDGSIPGRCIDFARQGFVVLSLDMIGYNDSFQLPHDGSKSRAQLVANQPMPYEPREFRADFVLPEARIYGFSLGGLQLLNSIRGVDFLCSLPEVDPERIGATGASGGATQTILLMAVDDRIKVAAPVNIIGAAKHPGCGCENMPGLWIDNSTVELAASFAPRPLLLVSATRDPWTHSTPTREYPLIRKFFALYGSEHLLKNVHVDAGHNYNAESRAAVYDWFCSHLKAPLPVIREPLPVSPEPARLGDLRVFPDRVLPTSALSGRKILAQWIDASEASFLEQVPASREQWQVFSTQFGPALAAVLSVEKPAPNDIESTVAETRTLAQGTYERSFLGRSDRGDWLELESLTGTKRSEGCAVLAAPEDWGGLSRGASAEIVNALLKHGYRVYLVGGFASGQYLIPMRTWLSFSWPEAYNRDNSLNAVQDIVTALTWVKANNPGQKILAVGAGQSGPPLLFAAAAFGEADGVMVDLDRSDLSFGPELESRMPVGGIQRLGGYRTPVLLLMAGRLLLANGSPTFKADWISQMAGVLGYGPNIDLQLEKPLLAAIE